MPMGCARRGGALVDVGFARVSRVPGGARARERTNSVLAGAPVFAWVRAAFVNIRLAMRAFKPSRTAAIIRVCPVWSVSPTVTSSTVLTGVCIARPIFKTCNIANGPRFGAAIATTAAATRAL